MTISTDTTQMGLDALLSILEKNDLTDRPVGRPARPRNRGTANTDFLTGDDRTNVFNGKRGDDVLNGKGGDDRLAGGNGNDLLFGGEGNDALSGGNNRDFLFGGLGDDQLNGDNGNDVLDGGIGVDTLLGGNGNDMVVGGDGVDTLTGGAGRDQFVYRGNMFANGVPAPAGTTGINVLGQPDIITDYTIGEDQFLLDALDLGMDPIAFQKGTSGQIANGNVIVLTDTFAAAGAAARAIANNNSITAEEGVFVYFNTTLGLNRVVYSKDLGNGGDISILANLDNQRGAAGQAALANFTAADFALG